MNARTRTKLDMAGSVLDFSQAHPYDNPGYIAAVSRLAERTARGLTLSAQQRVGRIAERNATTRRRELRRQLQGGPLLHLSRIARAASKEDPSLERRFRRPAFNASNQAYLVAARTIAAEAESQREVLARYGMGETMPHDLAAALEQYDQAVKEAHAGKGAHVGARADLAAVMQEIAGLVDQLDGINRYRFRNDPEQLGAWLSAKDLPSRKKRAGGDGGGGGGEQVA